ncbi:MAG: ImmA/IrrE family metallo-endopeptidase [Proteobacteria bacterium]|nr:ImmA/IrrE family metallo-endopeptidase [Pseudomonadota bacterium]
MAEKRVDLAERLKNERESLKLTKKYVAEKMGFPNYQTLGAIEDGIREVKAWELHMLSGIYGRSPDYFFNYSGPDKPEPMVIFRGGGDSQEIQLLTRRFLALCSRYKKLFELTGEKCEEPEIDLPAPNKERLLQKEYEYVSKLADEHLKMLEVGRRPAFPLSMALESRAGIKIIFLPFGKTGSGASAIGDFGRAILINSNEAPWRRNYDLAHEFFHIITWDLFKPLEHLSESGKQPVEKWADAFASALLMPENETREEFLKHVESRKITYLSLVQMARDFGVSTEAMLWRLVNLQLLKRPEVMQLLDEGKLKVLDREKRVADWDEEKPYLSQRYIALAIKAFQIGKISKAKFAEYIEKPLSEVSNFLKKHGYDENEDYSLEFATARC